MQIQYAQLLPIQKQIVLIKENGSIDYLGPSTCTYEAIFMWPLLLISMGAHGA